ncbi:hypothetical protein HAX54_009716 [Datura stramonium]|uniref:Uncharacterized protein n=1 Tax=Datura stramonium TaxID=4076 RepID=A0ABS8TH48_DATST|nr:hypothetical protein [Datura stramonium]
MGGLSLEMMNGDNKKQKVAPVAGPRKNLQLAVMEPGLKTDGLLGHYLGYPRTCRFSLKDFESGSFELVAFAQLAGKLKRSILGLCYQWWHRRKSPWRELLHGEGILYASKRLSLLFCLQAARMYPEWLRNNQHITKWGMDYSDLRAKLLRRQGQTRPIINVTIGTTFKGAVDDLDIILQTLKDCGYSEDMFYIHCDAALCGLMIPFINNMISFKPIEVSPLRSQVLRMPNAAMVSNNKKSYINNLAKEILSAKGQIGLQKDVKRCLDNANYLKDRLQQAGISVMLNKLSIIVASPNLDNFVNELVQQRKQWYQGGGVEPPCVADDIGAQNCACSYHKLTA